MMIRFLGRFKPTGSPVRGSRTTREERGREVAPEEGVVMVIEVGENREKVMITAENYISHSNPLVIHQRSVSHSLCRITKPRPCRLTKHPEQLFRKLDIPVVHLTNPTLVPERSHQRPKRVDRYLNEEDRQEPEEKGRDDQQPVQDGSFRRSLGDGDFPDVAIDASTRRLDRADDGGDRGSIVVCGPGARPGEGVAAVGFVQ